MRLPESVSERVTKASKKKPLEAVSIFSDAGTALEEFGITESGIEIQAYVNVSPGDPITIGFEIPCMEAQIVDVFIDGVLRESIVTTSRPVTTHRGKIAEVCVCGIRPSGAKGKLEYSQMVVEDRKTTKDVRPSSPGFEDMPKSAVGTIEVRVLREISSAIKSGKDINPEQAERGPTFEGNLRWWDVSRRVDPGLIAPTYQIGFVNGRKTHGSSRKNINRSIEGYYLWASFKFIYRSASDIQAAGFVKNEKLSNLSPNTKAERSHSLNGKMEGTQLAAASTVDEKRILSLKAVPGVSINQIGSDSLQQLETGPVNSPHDHESTECVEQVKEDFQVVTPAKCTPTSDLMNVVAVSGELNTSEIGGEQRSLHSYCETEYSEDETDQTQAPSFRSFLEMANGKKAEHEQPVEQNIPKRAPLPASHHASIAIAEQAIPSSAQEAVAPDAETAPIFPKTKDFQHSLVGTSHINRGESSGLSSKQEWDRRIRKLAKVFAPETNSRTLTEHPNSEEFNLETIEKATVQGSDRDKSFNVPSLTQLPSFSQNGRTGAAEQELRNDRDPGFALMQKDISIQRNTSNTMMRAKAGHYILRSPLVDLDTEDIEKQAKAMTNGKGDWRARVSHLAQEFSAPSKNRALVEDTLSRTMLEQTANPPATVLLPSLVADTPKKRNFGAFNADAGSILRPDSGIPRSLSNRNVFGISPKERRHELARKKRVKQEALEKARAEADALRKQVEKFEAEQYEALAREEAELENLDLEIKNIQGEAQALAARLRELHEQ